MICANCRARFTAEDFDFVVQTLAASPKRSEAVSLLKLLSDPEVRDEILDSELIVESILSQSRTLRISPQFYFYILARKSLQERGMDDRRLSDYVGAVLDDFVKTSRLAPPGVHTAEAKSEMASQKVACISDMLIALQSASSQQAFLLRAHVGNYSLFLTGIFRECVEHRSRYRGAPAFSYYEDVGIANYRIAADHSMARRCEMREVYGSLSEQFREVRIALNHLAERLVNIDDDRSEIVRLLLQRDNSRGN